MKYLKLITLILCLSLVPVFGQENVMETAGTWNGFAVGASVQFFDDQIPDNMIKNAWVQVSPVLKISDKPKK